MEGVGLGTAGEDTWSAFNAYFADQQREIGMLAYRLCGAADVAEEVAADAFAEAWRRWDELTGDAARPSAAAMGAIVERLVQRRVHRAGRTPTPRAAGEPDMARVRALLFERISLIPPQDAPTVTIPRIVEPIAGDEPEPAGRRFPRPLLIGGLIATGAVVVIGAIATAASNSGSPTDTNAPLSLAASGTMGAVASAAPGSVNTSASPSPSASASPSHSPSASPTPTASTPSASPSTTAPAQSASATGSTSAPDALTVAAAVNGGSNSSWTQLDVTTSVQQNLSALTITINVAYCSQLNAAGAWDSGAGGQFDETTTQNGDGSITYVFALTSGDEVTPGDISFAAQFSHSRHGWSASADSYSVSAEAAGGGTETFSGSF